MKNRVPSGVKSRKGLQDSHLPPSMRDIPHHGQCYRSSCIGSLQSSIISVCGMIMSNPMAISFQVPNGSTFFKTVLCLMETDQCIIPRNFLNLDNARRLQGSQDRLLCRRYLILAYAKKSYCNHIVCIHICCCLCTGNTAGFCDAKHLGGRLALYYAVYAGRL